MDIALSQVDHVVRKKRPNVDLGDVGYGNHDARGVMPSPGRASTFRNDSPISIWGPARQLDRLRDVVWAYATVPLVIKPDYYRLAILLSSWTQHY